MFQQPVRDNVLFRLLLYLRRYKTRMIFGTMAVVATTALAVARPLVVRQGIDSVAAGITREVLVELAYLIVGLAAMDGVFRFSQRCLMIGV